MNRITFWTLLIRAHKLDILNISKKYKCIFQALLGIHTIINHIYIDESTKTMHE